MSVVQRNQQLRHVTLARPKAFVCHASEDAGIAADIASKLLSVGLPVWLDKLCILPGQDWEQLISQGVDSSHAVVVLISKNSVDKTGYLQREIRLALEQADRRPEGSVFIVPLLVDDTLPPQSFKRWQWVRMSDPTWFDDICSAMTVHTKHNVSLRSDDAHTHASVVLSRIRSGNDGTVDFVIDLKTGDGLSVGLGLSVFSHDGKERFDIRLDRRVSLRSGVAAYRRRIPSPYEDGDRVVGAVWLPNVPQGTDDGAECLGRLEYQLSLPTES